METPSTHGLTDEQVERRLCTLAQMAAALEAADRASGYRVDADNTAPSFYANRAQQLFNAVELRQLPDPERLLRNAHAIMATEEKQARASVVGWHGSHRLDWLGDDKWKCTVCEEKTLAGPGWGKLAEPCAGKPT